MSNQARKRRARLATAVLALCVAFCIQLAAEDIHVLSTDIDGRELLTMSVSQTDSTGVSIVGDTTISIETERTWRRFVATAPDGNAYSDWYNVGGFTKWVAFDPQDMKFRVLSPRIKVIASDYSKLAKIAKELGATRTKLLEPLGYAVVSLPENVNPASAVNTLRLNPVVRFAEVQFEKPLEVPM